MAHSRIDIARPPEAVFAYMTDPAKLGTWQDAEEVEQLTPGPVGAGTRFREVHKAMGRRRVEITEIVVFEPGRRFDIRVVDGPPVDARWDYEPHGAGTRLTFTPSVRLPGPLAGLVGIRHDPGVPSLPPPPQARPRVRRDLSLPHSRGLTPESPRIKGSDPLRVSGAEKRVAAGMAGWSGAGWAAWSGAMTSSPMRCSCSRTGAKSGPVERRLHSIT